MAHIPFRVLGDMPEGQALLRGQVFGRRGLQPGYIIQATSITYTPGGTLTAMNVQAALDELESTKEPADATILKDADIGVSVQAYDAGIATVVASQAEMEAGTESAIRSMSPLLVAQAIAALGTGAVGSSIYAFAAAYG